MDFTAVDKRIAALEATRAKPCKVSPTEPLAVGLDLGTAYIVLAVVDSRQRPVACAVQSAQVGRDGLVVDYAGGLRMVRALREQLEDSLGRKLEKTAIAVPPGTGERDCATHRHVAEGAGLEVTALLDEPTAANNVLGVRDGAIVDIGGGTTGIAVLRGGQVTYVADEPTGGTHLSLVLAGNYDVDFEAAEALKKDPARQKEKMGVIIQRHVAGRGVQTLYLVGGTCCLPGMETVIARYTGLTARKPANPFLVTPLGIALGCGASA